MTLKDSDSDETMMSSTKVIEKLKHTIHKDCPTAEEAPCEDYEPMSYLMEHLTPAMEEEARTQLHENEESRAKGLEELRRLIQKERHLVSYMNDSFLLQFLRARKFNVKRAFKLLQNFWSFRKEHRDIYDISDPNAVRRLILKSKFGFLMHRDKHGSVVAFFKVGLWDPEEDTFEQLFRAVTAILLHSIKYPATQVCGFRMVMDLRELSWKQVKICTPKNVMLLIRSTQFCFPGRYKAVHILSENKLFNTVWAIVHPLLTMKLRKRVTLHGSDLSVLSQHIHPSILPEEYGGLAKTFNNDEWEDIIVESTDYVMDMLSYGYKD